MLNTKSLPGGDFQRQPTRKELFDISKKISKDFSPAKPVINSENVGDMLLTRQQLLEVSENISLYYAPRILSNTHTLTLLPIDPEHFYVYWNLADYHEYSNDNHHQDYELKLRVFSHDKEYSKSRKAKLVFETNVAGTQSRQKISVQKTEQGVVYTASLGKSLTNNGFIALVSSNEVYSLYQTNTESHLSHSSDVAITTEIDLFEDFIEIGDVGFPIEKGNNPAPVKSDFVRTNLSGQGKKLL